MSYTTARTLPQAPVQGALHGDGKIRYIDVNDVAVHDGLSVSPCSARSVIKCRALTGAWART